MTLNVLEHLDFWKFLEESIFYHSVYNISSFNISDSYRDNQMMEIEFGTVVC